METTSILSICLGHSGYSSIKWWASNYDSNYVQLCNLDLEKKDSFDVILEKKFICWGRFLSHSFKSMKGLNFRNNKSLANHLLAGASHVFYTGKNFRLNSFLIVHTMPCTFVPSESTFIREFLVLSFDQWIKTCPTPPEWLYNDQRVCIMLTNHNYLIWTNRNLRVMGYFSRLNNLVYFFLCFLPLLLDSISVFLRLHA